uniref:Uncharacterized protein n=1 Tax=Zea mays TaxID=4577 RepID=A0A804RL14_MAIZE
MQHQQRTKRIRRREGPRSRSRRRELRGRQWQRDWDLRRLHAQNRRAGEPSGSLLRAGRRHPEQALHSARVRGRHGGLHQRHAGRQAEPAAAGGDLAVDGHAGDERRHRDHGRLRHEHHDPALQCSYRSLLAGHRRPRRCHRRRLRRRADLLQEERYTAVTCDYARNRPYLFFSFLFFDVYI